MKNIIRLIVLLSLVYSRSSMSLTSVSYSLRDIDTGKLVDAKLEKSSFPPASVSKLLTAYYVLNSLKNNFQFKTTLISNAIIKNGKLQGDLTLVGSGDPYLTAPDLISLIYQLKQKGVTEIQGTLNCYGSMIKSGSEISKIGLPDQADNPSYSSLNLEFNRFKVFNYLETTTPPLKNLNILKKDVSSYGQKYTPLAFKGMQERWQINAKEISKSTESLPTKNSTNFTCGFFNHLLNKHQITTKDYKTITKLKSQKTLATHLGVSLIRLVQLTLEYSNNLMAEMLLIKASGEESIKSATSEMISWYKNRYPNFKWDKINLVNGSGLSVKSSLSTSFLSKLLREIYFEKNPQERPFISVLPINAHSGSISRRIKQPTNSFSIYAKSGSLYYVNNLAGYLIANSGKIYSFSYFSSDKEKRKVLTKGNSKKSEQLRKEFKSWYSATTSQMDKKLIHWLKNY